MSSSTFGNFLSKISSGSYVASCESGTGAFSYGGQNDSLLSDLGRRLTVSTTTVAGTTNFQTGGSVVDGQVTTFTVAVPEPAAIAPAAI